MLGSRRLACIAADPSRVAIAQRQLPAPCKARPSVRRGAPRHQKVSGIAQSAAAKQGCNTFSAAHTAVQCRASRITRAQVLAGDAAVLVAMCLFKHVVGVATGPEFPGWLAAPRIDPAHAAALLGLAGVVVSSWVGTAALKGDYRSVPTGMSSPSTQVCCSMLLSDAAKPLAWFNVLADLE